MPHIGLILEVIPPELLLDKVERENMCQAASDVHVSKVCLTGLATSRLAWDF